MGIEGFKPKQPELPRSEKVQEFYSENPAFDIQKSLTFLTEEYPDIDSWMIHSGVAIQILKGSREVEASDLDILCRDDEMEADFGTWNGTDMRWRRYLDAKSINHWLRGRTDSLDGQTAWGYMLSKSSIVELDGATFRMMHPAFMAAEKSTLAKMTLRPKDYADLQLLDVDETQILAATNVIHGNNSESNLSMIQ